MFCTHFFKQEIKQDSSQSANLQSLQQENTRLQDKLKLLTEEMTSMRNLTSQSVPVNSTSDLELKQLNQIISEKQTLIMNQERTIDLLKGELVSLV